MMNLKIQLKFVFLPPQSLFMKIKTTFLVYLSLMSAAIGAEASRAFKYTKTVMQRDGTQITLVHLGDEDLNYWATSDGVPVMAAPNGEWRYARFSQKGRLVATDRLAHDPALRDYLECREVKLLQNDFRKRINKTEPLLRYAIGRRSDASIYSIGRPHVPVILVQYADIPLMAENSLEKFRYHFNGENYKGEGGAGSVRDYFISQSDSLFQPTFDLIGPVTLSKNASEYGKNNTYGVDIKDNTMIMEAINLAIASGTDFSVYATEGKVPLVGVIFAGFGEQACNEKSIKGTIYESVGVDNTIWAKYKPRFNYVTPNLLFSAALCTNEVANYDGKGPKMDGIGTFCHEFSHAMGLPDLYGPAGCFGMDYWDLMDYGQYVKNGTSPVGYSAYERNFMGWLTIDTLDISKKQKVNVTSLADCGGNRAYKIINPQNANEYYILENRQPSTWFHKIFGHGLLIYHVDYKESVWMSGKVNDDVNHQRMTVIPADNVLTPAYIKKSFDSYKGDFFPGLTNNTSLTDETIPSDTVYEGGYMHVKLNDISEDSRHNVVFAFMADGILKTPASLSVLTNPKGSDSTTVKAEWGISDHAAAYAVKVARADGEVRNDTVAANVYEFDVINENIEYELTVTAVADEYINSDCAKVNFTSLPSGIHKAERENEPVEVYDIRGLRQGRFADRQKALLKIRQLAPGVYILKQKERILKIENGK